MSDAKISTNDLSNSACYALLYAQCLVYGPKSKYAAQWRAGQEHMDKQGISAHDRAQILARGLSELRDLGIVDCERDGMGDLVPKTLHEEKLVAADARLISKDLQ